MGRVAGDLDVFGISNLLQVLFSAQCHGLLTISSGPSKKVIQFLPEGIRLLSGVRRTNPLGEILVRSGVLSATRLKELLERQKSTGQRLGDLVVELEILSRETLDSALREQVAEEIYELFTWNRATFDFLDTLDGLPAEEEGPLARVVLEANVMSIMIEAARRMDELERIRAVIPDDRLVPLQVELPVSFDDLGLERQAVEEILPLADGTRSIERILDDSLYPRFTVLRTLYGLSERGILKIQDRRESEGPITVIGRRHVASAGEKQSRGKILIVSELGTFRAALAWYLRNEGYAVLESTGMDPWTETLCQECISAVVLDAPIESDDVLSMCERLRNASNIPFIVLSSNASRKALANALQSGARHVLVKPLKEAVLAQRLSELISVPQGSTPKD